MVFNQFKTVILLGALTGLLLLVGQLLGGQGGLFIGLLFALVINFGSYWFSDKIVLMMYGAKEAKKSDYPELYNIVKEVAMSANIPTPKVYIVNSSASNAFATGRNPKHSAVACTDGILKILTKEELRGVIAHEISHIKNRDTLISTIAATIAGVISYIAMMAKFSAIFGGGDRDREGSGNIIGLLLIAIITPIIAMLIQMAISRSREYLADESGARLVRNGEPLAKALEKLEQDVKHGGLSPTPAHQATSHMFISNPFKNTGGFMTLFMTHPATSERTKRLRSIRI